MLHGETKKELEEALFTDRKSISVIIQLCSEMFKNKQLTSDEKKRNIRKLLENSSDAARAKNSPSPSLNAQNQILTYLDAGGVVCYSPILNKIKSNEPLNDSDIDYLLNFEGDLLVNREGRMGRTLLEEAVRADDRDLAEWLIKIEGANVNLWKGALQTACLSELPEMAQMLIDNGADVNRVYGENETLLTWAEKNNKQVFVDLLRDNGGTHVPTVVSTKEAIKESVIILKRMFEQAGSEKFKSLDLEMKVAAASRASQSPASFWNGNNLVTAFLDAAGIVKGAVMSFKRK